MDSIFTLTGDEFKSAIAAYNQDELAIFIHDMNPSQRKYFIDNLSNDDIKEFLNKIPKQEKDRFMKLIGDAGVDAFWKREKELVQQGKGTRDWTIEQQQAILAGETPTYVDNNGKPKSFEGHHMYSKNEYPKYAMDPNNIQALTKIDEHLSGVHGGWHTNSHQQLLR